MKSIRISYFTDILCVWAYVAQRRIDELKATFGDLVAIDYHFCSVFGDVPGKLERSWSQRGGVEAYSAHVRGVAGAFDHATVHPEIWLRNTPNSSISPHLFLSAVKLATNDEAVESGDTQTAFGRATWELRQRFFTNTVDISDQGQQMAIAKDLGLPIAAVEAQLRSGRAHAALSADLEKVREFSVQVSPTLIFNEGRQRLHGNVGYRVIEANVRELLHHPPDELSWC